MNKLDKEIFINSQLLNETEILLCNNNKTSSELIELQSVSVVLNDNLNVLPVINSNEGIQQDLSVQIKNKKNKFLGTIVTISILQIVLFYSLNENLYENLIYVPEKRQKELWRLLTYGFVHEDHLHLWLNMIYQILFAIPLEMEQNFIPVLLVYVCGIITGALGTSHFHKNVQLIGASAGVYSLFGSHIPNLILNFGSLSYKYFRIYCIVVLCLSDVMYSAYILKTKPDSIISIVVHCYGATTGIFIGFSTYTKTTKLTKYLFIFITFSWLIFIQL